jgi:hypothetical protein
MKHHALLAGLGLVAAGLAGSALAQPLPDPRFAPFPYAAPHEVRTFNGVPCRTMYDPATGTRVPIACADDLESTGSIAAPVPTIGVAPPFRGASRPFPYAAPHEVQIFNGVPCRTVYDPGTQRRFPVECAY